MYISTDDGAHWEYRDPGLGVRKATCVAFDPDNASEVFLGVVSPNRWREIPRSQNDGGGVWRSSDAAVLPGEHSLTLETTEWRAGVYILTVETTTGTHSRRVSIIRYTVALYSFHHDA